MDRRVVLFAGVTLASVFLGLTGRSIRAQQEQEVGLREFAIEPSSFTANVGDTVHFHVTNQGAREHTLELELESAGIEQALFPANLTPGQSDTVELTFSQPGTWVLYCPIGQHRDRGMLASVQVQEAAEAPASEPQESAPPPQEPAPPTTTPVPTSAPRPTNTPVPQPPAAPSRRGY